MLNSKFISIFNRLSKSERIMLNKFIRSPYHNLRTDVIKLAEYIYSKKTLTEATLQKEKIYEYVYPGTIFNTSIYRHLLSFATKVMEDFLVHHYINTESLLHKKIILAKKYRQLYLNKCSKYVIEVEIPKLKPIEDSVYYYYQTVIQSEKYMEMNQDRRNIDSNLKDIANTQLDYIIIETMKLAIQSHLNQQIKAESNQIPLLMPVMNIINQSNIPLQPLSHFYFTAYRMLTENNSEHYFFEIVNILFNKKNIIPKSEIKDILLLTINYCIKKINSGVKEFSGDAFNLYLYGIENKILLEAGTLSRFTFTNTITIGLQLNKIREMKLFIEKFKCNLPQEERERTVQFNYIRLNYAEKKYKPAMLGILTTDFKDVFWNLTAKFTIIKIYFEQKELDTLYQYLNSFRVFLYRQKKIGYHKKRYQNIIRFTKMLMKCSTGSKNEKANVISKIKNCNDLPDKDWFLAQFTMSEIT